MLMINEMMNTVMSFFESIMAETAGIIRNENTGITPLILTAKTMASPMEI